MKYLPLIWAGLWRKPARTAMSILSLMTAFLLFGLLRSVDAGFDTLIAAGQPDRLFLSPRFFGAPMPVSYVDQVAKIDGVAEVGYQFFANGYSRDPKTQFFVGGASANMFNLYSEVGATPAEIEALKAKPNGLLITPAMATHLGGVKIGDHIPLHSNEVRQKNGSPDWDFELVGFIDRKEAPGIYSFSFGNYDFMNEARADPKNTVQQIAVRVFDRTRAVAVARAIDALFVNSGLPTRTVVDQVNRQSTIASLGNIKFITDGVLATVLFVLLLLTAATVTQSVDERTNEFAVLKTLGFTDGGIFNLVLAEALSQCVTGAALGLAAASFVSPLMQGRMPGPPAFFRMPPSVFVLGLVAAALVAAAAAAFPGLRASRLQIAEALGETVSAMGQTTAIVAMNLSALRTRWGSSLVIVLAVLSLGAISTAMLSIATGAIRSMDTLKQRDDAVVLSVGAQFEQQSSISREAALKIADAPGVRKTADGKPLAVAEIIAAIPVVTRDKGFDRPLLVRGGSPLYFQLHPEFHLVDGRMFQPGLRELLIGREAHEALVGMDVGAKVAFPDGEWTIVGMYESNGRADWQLYGDAETMMTAFHRNAYHSMTVKLETPAAFAGFKAALGGDPTLNLLVERESDFWDRMNALQVQFYRMIGLWVGGIVALGVIFASANMLYAAVSRRVIEIATLRALGFGATAVVVSVMAESLVLAAIGAAVGIFGAWAGFDGVNYIGGGFHLAVTPALALGCAAGTLGVGVLASLFPAIRAARLPVAAALQQR